MYKEDNTIKIRNCRHPFKTASQVWKQCNFVRMCSISTVNNRLKEFKLSSQWYLLGTFELSQMQWRSRLFILVEIAVSFLMKANLIVLKVGMVFSTCVVEGLKNLTLDAQYQQCKAVRFSNDVWGVIRGNGPCAYSSQLYKVELFWLSASTCRVNISYLAFSEIWIIRKMVPFTQLAMSIGVL